MGNIIGVLQVDPRQVGVLGTLFGTDPFVVPTLYVKGIIVKLIGYVFFLFFMASVGALYQSSGLNLFGHGLSASAIRQP